MKRILRPILLALLAALWRNREQVWKMALAAYASINARRGRRRGIAASDQA